MKLEKLAAIGEIVSSVAIVATLAYLAIQTRQNTAAIQANGRQATTGIEIQLLLSQTERPDMWARQTAPDLTDEEKAYFTAWMVAFFRLRELDWFNYQRGVLDDVQWQSYRSAIGSVLATERSRKWWDSFATAGFNQAFVADVYAKIAESPATTENNMLTPYD
jgi:hypothetical protein